MNRFPIALQLKLLQREESASLRVLSESKNLIDFSSNDYLGLSANEKIFHQTHHYLLDNKILDNGATGSRLLSGNHKLYKEVENFLEFFHHSEAALIFNSGYDANVGFFSAVLQKNDIVLYDEFCHASIRDGIQMSHAKPYKFKHNDVEHLKKLLDKFRSTDNRQQPTTIYIITESVFSMDGDIPDFEKIVALSNEYQAYLVADEAHALGVIGKKGEGVIQSLGLEKQVFARIITFGKALGCHGAAILGSEDLKSYIVNFSRSFVYSTALSPHSVASILIAYQIMIEERDRMDKLHKNILFFTETLHKLLPNQEANSQTPIQSIIVSGNENVKKMAVALQSKGFDVKPILSPTVPKGKERLRFCLHSYNTEQEIYEVLEVLSTLI